MARVWTILYFLKNIQKCKTFSYNLVKIFSIFLIYIPQKLLEVTILLLDFRHFLKNMYLFLVGSFPTDLPWWDCTFKLDFRVYFWDWNHQLLCVMLLCSILRGKNSSLLLTRSSQTAPLSICKGWTDLFMKWGCKNI